MVWVKSHKNVFLFVTVNRRQWGSRWAGAQLLPKHGNTASDGGWVRPAHRHSRALLRSLCQTDFSRWCSQRIHQNGSENKLAFLCCVLPADRAPLQAAHCVDKMQELILDLLSRVCRSQAGAARGGTQRFGRLLGRLTELRTLHHNYLLLTGQQPGLWWREGTRNRWWRTTTVIFRKLREWNDSVVSYELRNRTETIF